MKRKTFIAILVAVLAIASSWPVFAGKGKRPHPSKLKYKQIELSTPEVQDLEFGNGLTGFLIEDHEVPVVDVVLLIRNYYPEKEKYGLNQMAGWVIRNGGTETWPATELNEELEFLAAQLEVSGEDLSTTAYLNCMKKDLPRLLEIFADLVMNPAFPEEKVEMRRKTMLEEIRRRNDQPRKVARREYFKLIYEGHPYGWEQTVPSVKAIGRDDLVAFHEDYFYPNNAIIGVSGDVTREEIVEVLGDVFGAWKPAEATVPEPPEVTSVPTESYNYIYKDINQAYMMLGHIGINARNDDRCAVNIMNYILGGGSFTSWITERVRSDEGLAYSTGSVFSSDPFAKGVFYAYAQTKLDAYSRALQLMVEQMKRMRNEGPTDEEVGKAIDSYVNSHVFDYESKRQVMQRLVMLRFQGRPLDTPERDMEAYAKVGVEDIKRVAKKYLVPDKLTVLIVGNAEHFDRPLRDFGPVNVIELEEE